MFNFDTGPFNPGQIDMSGSGMWARLDLHAPQSYGTQVLRPFVYGFGTDTVDTLLSKGDNIADVFKRKDVQNSSVMSEIIKPDPTGVMIHMDGFNACWSFVLTIHIPNNVNSGILAAEGSKYLIFRGHCADEPVVPSSIYLSTPIINKECRLIVHSREIIRNNPKIINAFGNRGTTDVCGAVDVIDGCLNVCSDNRELFVIKPSDVLENYSLSGLGESVSAPGLCSITNDRQPISTSLKNPGLHLKQIIQGISATEEEMKVAEFAPHGFDSFNGAMSPMNDCSVYKENVVSQLSMMGGAGEVSQGVDIKGVVTIADVERAYPNLVVQPITREVQNMMMDIVPQEGVSKKTVYSSMAASAISSIASGCGLASIAFMYTSYNPNKGDSLDKSDYRVKEEMCTLTCPPADPNAYGNTLKAAVQLFMMKMHNDLEPFIKYTCGDFMLTATYSLDTETRVDLQFLDDANMSAGWFETPSRLSSLSSTSVGTKDNFTSNGHALNAFVLGIQGKTQKNALGLSAFDRPIMEAPVESSLDGVFSASL